MLYVFEGGGALDWGRALLVCREPGMEPIEIKHLEQYVFGDRALLDEILTIFIEQASMLLSRFDPALDNDTWHTTAHSLKGASRGVGAWALGDIAERAEKLEGAESIPARVAIMRELEAAGGEAIVYARQVRDSKAA